jgi:hypothetical protein
MIQQAESSTQCIMKQPLPSYTQPAAAAPQYAQMLTTGSQQMTDHMTCAAPLPSKGTFNIPHTTREESKRLQSAATVTTALTARNSQAAKHCSLSSISSKFTLLRQRAGTRTEQAVLHCAPGSGTPNPTQHHLDRAAAAV